MSTVICIQSHSQSLLIVVAVVPACCNCCSGCCCCCCCFWCCCCRCACGSSSFVKPHCSVPWVEPECQVRVPSPLDRWTDLWTDGQPDCRLTRVPCALLLSANRPHFHYPQKGFKQLPSQFRIQLQLQLPESAPSLPLSVFVARFHRLLFARLPPKPRLQFHFDYAIVFAFKLKSNHTG